MAENSSGGVLIAYMIELLICIVVRMKECPSLYLCYVNPYFRILGEGAAGILLCEYRETIQEKAAGILQKLKMNYTVLETISVGIFFADFLLRDLFKWNVWQAWLQVIPMGLVLIVFQKGKGAISRGLARQEWQVLGKISFELYMTHAFVYEGIPIAVGMISKKLCDWLIYHGGTRFIVTFFSCILFGWGVNVIMNKVHHIE